MKREFATLIHKITIILQKSALSWCLKNIKVYNQLYNQLYKQN